MTRALRLKTGDLANIQAPGYPTGESREKPARYYWVRGPRVSKPPGQVINQNERFERLLEFQMTAANLPPFEKQVRYAPGRKFASDFGFPAFRLLVEVQGGIWRKRGGAHSGGTAIERDIEKAQLAVINGWWLFPVTTQEVTKGEALKLIEIALGAKGWKR